MVKHSFIYNMSYIYQCMRNYIHPDGYVMTVCADKVHRLQHTIVVEENIGRKLLKAEIVHHINEDKTDNRIENLSIMTLSDHTKLHRVKAKTIILKCSVCESDYEVREAIYIYKIKKGQTVFVCSKHCGGLLNKKYLNHDSSNKYNTEEFNVMLHNEMEHGMTAYAIAKKYGLERSTVQKYIKLLAISEDK